MYLSNLTVLYISFTFCSEVCHIDGATLKWYSTQHLSQYSLPVDKCISEVSLKMCSLLLYSTDIQSCGQLDITAVKMDSNSLLYRKKRTTLSASTTFPPPIHMINMFQTVIFLPSFFVTFSLSLQVLPCWACERAAWIGLGMLWRLVLHWTIVQLVSVSFSEYTLGVSL